MRLKYIECFHHALLPAAFIASVFFGILISFSNQMAEHKGQTELLVTLPISALTQVRVDL